MNVETIRYAERHDLRLDLYRGPQPDRDPLVLYVHGGGFRRGSRTDHPDRLRALRDAGLSVASVDYRLAPDARYPDPIHDVAEAAAFLRREGATLGVRTGRIGAIGASAGGYLVAAASLRPETGIAAVSPWFAPFDLWASSRRSPLEQELRPVGYELDLLGDLDPSALREASPAHRDLSTAPPFLLVHGDRDVLVPLEQSLLMHEALLRAGRESTMLRLGGAGHEDPRFDGGPVVQTVAAWFRAVLGAG